MEVDGVGIGNSSHHTVDIEVELWDCSGDHKYAYDLFLFIVHLLTSNATAAWNFLDCPAGIYLLKVNNRNNRTRCEICSELTIKTPSFWCLYC